MTAAARLRATCGDPGRTPIRTHLPAGKSARCVIQPATPLVRQQITLSTAHSEQHARLTGTCKCRDVTGVDECCSKLHHSQVDGMQPSLPASTSNKVQKQLKLTAIIRHKQLRSADQNSRHATPCTSCVCQTKVCKEHTHQAGNTAPP